MEILAHRGQWNEPKEKNTMESFARAFQSGFGIETDIRDFGQELVIAHDLPKGGEGKFAEVIELYQKIGAGTTLAINVKSDGLQHLLRAIIADYGLKSYFVFDMSIPDAYVYGRVGICFYTRQSEIEPDPVLYDKASGVWMDMFVSDWIMPEMICKHIDDGKNVSLVSPELHGREYKAFWERIASSEIVESDRFQLCTDYPEEAKSFFNL